MFSPTAGEACSDRHRHLFRNGYLIWGSIKVLSARKASRCPALHRPETPTLTRDLVLGAVKKRRPDTVGELAEIVQTEHGLDQEVVVELVKAMVKDRSMVLRKPTYLLESMLDYLMSPTLSGWFWLVLGITGVVVALVLGSQDLLPINMLRVILGCVFVLYMLGYGFVQFLFPNEGDLGLAPIVASLSVFTVTSAFAAMVRKYMILQHHAATVRAGRFG